MFDWIKRHRLSFAIAVVLVGTLVLLFQARQASDGSRIQSIAQTVTYPIQIVFHHLFSVTSEVANSYLYLVQLQKENKELRQQISSLQEEVNQYIEESIQYHRLKVQLEFAEQNPNRKIFTEVIGESIDNFHQTLQINRGSIHGIQRNFAVILKEGVVGRIQTVSPFQSTVQLILDRRMRFPAIIQRTRAKGLVYGTHEGLELRRIHLRADIKEGDRIVTNGLSALFPKGLLVGIVTSIESEEHELFQTAKIRPVVDFDKIEGAFVVLEHVEPPPPPPTIPNQ